MYRKKYVERFRIREFEILNSKEIFNIFKKEVWRRR